MNHGPAGMPNVSENTTDDVMVFMIEGDGDTTTEDLNGTGTNTTGDWVTGTPYPIIDSDAITTTYAISFWPTIYTICPNGIIQESGQATTDVHYDLAYECAISSLDVQLEDNSVSSVQDAGTDNAFTLSISNNNEMTSEMLEITVTSDAPADWSQEITVGSMTDATTVTLDAAALSDNELSLAVTAGSTAALANYTVHVASITYPNNPVVIMEYFVASGITDLVVDNGGVSTDMNPDFVAGLDAAGNTTYAVLDIEKFTEAIVAGQLSEVGHVYYNVGWTFPSFTEAGVEALELFMDAGGNLMVVGQDVAWDTFNNEGTAATQAFMNNYLGVDYVGDGSGADNEMTYFANDPLFGAVGTSSVENIYGGANIYPDQIEPLGDAVGIFHYGSDVEKFGGARLEQNSSKVIYIGVDLLMIGDEAARTATVEITHDWFHGVISNVSEPETASIIGTVYPNPASNDLVIPFTNLKEDAQINLYNTLGELVFSSNVSKGAANYALSVANLPTGVYTLNVVTESKLVSNELIQVMR